MTDKIEVNALRAKDACRYCGVGKTTFYRYLAAGRIPPGRKLTSHCVVWLRSELDAFLASAGEKR